MMAKGMAKHVMVEEERLLTTAVVQILKILESNIFTSHLSLQVQFRATLAFMNQNQALTLSEHNSAFRPYQNH